MSFIDQIFLFVVLIPIGKYYNYCTAKTYVINGIMCNCNLIFCVISIQIYLDEILTHILSNFYSNGNLISTLNCHFNDFPQLFLRKNLLFMTFLPQTKLILIRASHKNVTKTIFAFLIIDSFRLWKVEA